VSAQQQWTPLRVIAAGLMLAFAVGLLAYASRKGEAANSDFICYWATGKQLVHRLNPYDLKAVPAIEHAAGMTISPAAFMRNPPYALFLTLPLGLLSARAGSVIWTLAIVLALMVSVRLLHKLHGEPAGGAHLLSYAFPPAVACLLAGQTAMFILLGLSLFLYYRDRKPYLAGAALLLGALKPHLIFPFAAVVLVWIIMRRQYRVAAGAVIAFSAALAVSGALDPHLLSHYAAMMHGENLQNPTLSYLLQHALAPHLTVLQFLPAGLAAVWAVWYFARNAEQWDWTGQGSLVLLLSLVVAPYAWLTDEAAAMPAVLAGLFTVERERRTLLPYCLIAGIALFEMLSGVHTVSVYYRWTAPAWLGWYCWVRCGAPHRALTAEAAAPHPDIAL
jgi:hypothetical protein